MKTIEIRSIYDVVLWSGEAGSIRDAVEKAVASGASLVGARLVGANLDGARLVGASLDGASLVGASLVGARLDGARLDGANLDGANLDGANLDGANLDGANLDPIRDDLFSVLDIGHDEVPALRAALLDGRVDGSAYQGDCACLVGTIANARHEPYNALTIALRPNSTRLSEVWFLAIKKGDTPANNPVAAITVRWVEAWITAHEKPIAPHAPVVWRGDLERFLKDCKAAGVPELRIA